MKAVPVKCRTCGEPVENYRAFNNGLDTCKACAKTLQDKQTQAHRIGKLCAGLNPRDLVPRHKGKR